MSFSLQFYKEESRKLDTRYAALTRKSGHPVLKDLLAGSSKTNAVITLFTTTRPRSGSPATRKPNGSIAGCSSARGSPSARV